MGLFTSLQDDGLLKDMCELIDLILDDNRFAYFSKTDMNKFTKHLKKIGGFSKNNFHYGATKNLKFKNRSTIPYAVFQSNSGQGRDFVRHIRNSIAHNNVKLRKVMDEHCLEMIDYKGNQQTSYILLSIKQLNNILEAYRISKPSLKRHNK